MLSNNMHFKKFCIACTRLRASQSEANSGVTPWYELLTLGVFPCLSSCTSSTTLFGVKSSCDGSRDRNLVNKQFNTESKSSSCHTYHQTVWVNKRYMKGKDYTLLQTSEKHSQYKDGQINKSRNQNRIQINFSTL
jgi:hypothetical protein